MATKTINQLSALDDVSTNLSSTLFVVYDSESGTTRKATLSQIDTAIEKSIQNVSSAAVYANAAYQTANSAGSYANSAYAFANTVNIKTDAAFTRANTANITADASYAFANTVNVKVDAAFAQANAANVLAQAAFNQANTGGNPFDQDLNTSNNVTFNEVTANNVYFDNLNLTGNIFSSTACSAINFVANSSGDGANSSTIQLIPDTNLTGTDQYLIIDPTAPGHIHIRAGGIQDDSAADLFIGGEYSYLKVHAGANSEVSITANSHQFRFGQTGYGVLQFPNLTYADLPQSPNIIAGQRAFINNANIAAPGNFGAVVSGGGANNTPVWSDGINWFIG